MIKRILNTFSGVAVVMATIISAATFYEVLSTPKMKPKTDEEQQNSTNNNNEVKNNEITLNGISKIHKSQNVLVRG